MVETNQTVCPGDYVIERPNGLYETIKPHELEEDYEILTEEELNYGN